MSVQMRVSLLGPVRAWTGQSELDLGSPQQRLVLAALVLARGRVLSRSQLVDVLWGGTEPPRSATAMIRSYISRLRHALGAGVIVSAGDGYSLGPMSTDLDDLDTLGGRAALDLWQGEALSGLPGDYAQAQRARLAERRLAVLESLLGEEVERGRYAESLSELTALRAEYPLRERLTGLLMRALQATGRQAEAIGVYTDARRLLDEELGVRPSQPLADLYQSIITADAPRETPAAERSVPAQLPADLADFTGRASLVAELSRALRPGAALAISALSGIGGVGKTTLAVHVAHRVRAEFPDGQLYADLRDADTGEVLSAFLRALGAAEVPDGLEERSALFRTLLADRRVLVLLDNAAGAAQLGPLLPGAPTCAVVATSRVRLAELAGARQVDVDVLDPREALDLLARIVGESRVAAERAAAMDLVAACGFLPLAIRIAAARLAARPAWTLSRLVERLADERRRLAELRVGELAVEATFALSYEQTSQDQARAFRLLALPDGPDLSLAAAADLLALPEREAEELCESLVDLSLVESPSPGRYRLHDLLRVFGRSHLTEDERHQGMDRLLDFYLATLRNAHRATADGISAEELAEVASPGVPLEDYAAAYGWLDQEAPSLAAALGQGAGVPELRVDLLADLASLLSSQVVRVTRSSAAIQACRAVLAVTERRQDAAHCFVQAALGHLLLDVGEAEGYTQLHAALDLARRIEQLDMVIDVCNTLGLEAYYERRYDEAFTLLRESIEVSILSGDQADLANTSLNLALVHIETGEHEEAARLARSALDLHRDPKRHSFALYTLARALGDSPEAVTRYEECVTISRAHKLGFRAAAALFRMAELRLPGDPAEAARLAEESLTVSDDLENPHVRGDALTVLGQALLRLDQPGRGRVCLEEAAAIFTDLGLPKAEDVQSMISNVG